MQTITESRKELENVYYNIDYLSKEVKSFSDALYNYMESLRKTMEELLACENEERISELDDLFLTRLHYIRSCFSSKINVIINTMESYTEEKKTLIKRLRTYLDVSLEILIGFNVYKSLKEKGK
jgi:predicted CopG family antitoxin